MGFDNELATATDKIWSRRVADGPRDLDSYLRVDLVLEQHTVGLRDQVQRSSRRRGVPDCRCRPSREWPLARLSLPGVRGGATISWPWRPSFDVEAWVGIAQ